MSRKAPTKARKSRQHGDAAAQAIDDDTYYVLRVILTGAPVVPFPFSKDLYLKVHKGQDDGLPDDRTLFVGALPLVLADENLAVLLSRYGAVERAAVHPNQISALVVFEQAKGRAHALAAAAAGATVDYDVPEPEGPYGVKAWLLEHQAQFPGNEVLGAQLDEWIANYEAEEDRKRKEREEAAAGEGWTVVKRHKGRHGDTAVGGVAVAKAAELGAAAQKKERVAADFYRAQKREKERDRLLQLRQDFEQDKQRVQQLRAARNFKPA